MNTEYIKDRSFQEECFLFGDTERKVISANVVSEGEESALVEVVYTLATGEPVTEYFSCGDQDLNPKSSYLPAIPLNTGDREEATQNFRKYGKTVEEVVLEFNLYFDWFIPDDAEHDGDGVVEFGGYQICFKHVEEESGWPIPDLYLLEGTTIVESKTKLEFVVGPLGNFVCMGLLGNDSAIRLFFNRPRKTMNRGSQLATPNVLSVLVALDEEQRKLALKALLALIAREYLKSDDFELIGPEEDFVEYVVDFISCNIESDFEDIHERVSDFNDVCEQSVSVG